MWNAIPNPLHRVLLTCTGSVNGVDHVTDGGTPDSAVLYPVLSSSCVAEDSQSGKGLQVCLDRGCPRLRLASSSPICATCETVWTDVGPWDVSHHGSSTNGTLSLLLAYRMRPMQLLSKVTGNLSSATRTGHVS